MVIWNHCHFQTNHLMEYTRTARYIYQPTEIQFKKYIEYYDRVDDSIYVAMASDGIYTIFWMAEMMRMIILLVIWEFQQLKIHLPTMQLEIPMNSSRL
tara:strand:- start:3078 stop:3371 length:294 start_codon:yes stop_codon:yes gene_type:complete